MRNLSTGVVTLVSENAAGTGGGDNVSQLPTISAMASSSRSSARPPT